MNTIYVFDNSHWFVRIMWNMAFNILFFMNRLFGFLVYLHSPCKYQITGKCLILERRGIYVDKAILFRGKRVVVILNR